MQFSILYDMILSDNSKLQMTQNYAQFPIFFKFVFLSTEFKTLVM